MRNKVYKVVKEVVESRGYTLLPNFYLDEELGGFIGNMYGYGSTIVSEIYVSFDIETGVVDLAQFQALSSICVHDPDICTYWFKKGVF